MRKDVKLGGSPAFASHRKSHTRSAEVLMRESFAPGFPSSSGDIGARTRTVHRVGQLMQGYAEIDY